MKTKIGNREGNFRLYLEVVNCAHVIKVSDMGCNQKCKINSKDISSSSDNNNIINFITNLGAYSYIWLWLRP